MATDEYVTFNGIELVNLARTVALAEVLGIDTVFTNPEEVAWIVTLRDDADYDDISTAPWYDGNFPASGEFAGIVPLAFAGMGDSTATTAIVEFTGDGGHPTSTRNATLPIVASVAIVASTERGAEYGKRWLDRTLKGGGGRSFCVGSDLLYMRFPSVDKADSAHYRDVSLTRGVSITRQRNTPCSSTWLATFTLTAGDPYEYGPYQNTVSQMGGILFGDNLSNGTLNYTRSSCAGFDYSPIYDPLYPALIAPPTSPNLLPEGWALIDGLNFERYWVRIQSPSPTNLNMVPLIAVSTTVEARYVIFSVFPSTAANDEQCDPLFVAVVSYLPPNSTLYIDGVQKACYTLENGIIRRCDTLVYSQDASPVQWTAFNDPDNLLLTLDILADSDGYEGDGHVRAAFTRVSKSD